MKNMYRGRNPEPAAATPREFIKAWQGSESVAEVAQKVRAKKNACRVRAFRYRQLGIPLKDLPSSPPAEPIDWDELAEYAASLLPQGPADDGSGADLKKGGEGENSDQLPTQPDTQG